MSNNYPPCIRGLSNFKKGCPLSPYNNITGVGCPAFVVLHISNESNPMIKEQIGKCIDLWQIDFKLKELGLLEGNQTAIESFRNGMCFKDEAGNVVPKANGAEIALLQMINKHKEREQIIFEHETIKKIEG